MPYFIELHAPGRPAERHQFNGEAWWVQCSRDGGTLRAAVPALDETREVRFVPKSEGVEVEAMPTGSTEIHFRGARAKHFLAPWGDEVFLGRVRIAFVETRRDGKARPFVLVALLLLLVPAVWFVIRTGEGSDSVGREALAPAPYEGVVHCSVQDAKAAEARATEAERIAIAKRERYAFDAKDGVLALPLFQEASACFRNAGRIQDAQRLATAFETWRDRVHGDYAALRLELRAARDQRSYRDARRATRELLALLALRPGDPYADWLRALDRDLETRLKVQK
jgi:hypothetical protein